MRLGKSVAQLSRRFNPASNRKVAPTTVVDLDGHAVPHIWPTAPASPWATPRGAEASSPVRCNICRWIGDEFVGPAHSEFAECPQCGSISRDRFLFHSLVARTADLRGSRLLETSPRIRGSYPDVMGQWFDYTSSDYDESAHGGMVQIDLQDTGLPDASFDLIMSPHVLEHVPETDQALSELRRIIAPGGRLVLQVPIQQGRTAPPVVEEFHGDNTPVFWRFGFDFTDRLRKAGFVVSLLCTEHFAKVASMNEPTWDGTVYPEFDVDDMLDHVIPTDLVVVADDATTTQLGFSPDYMFLTWECVVPL